MFTVAHDDIDGLLLQVVQFHQLVEEHEEFEDNVGEQGQFEQHRSGLQG